MFGTPTGRLRRGEAALLSVVSKRHASPAAAKRAQKVSGFQCVAKTRFGALWIVDNMRSDCDQ
jgi:hypothetical protein